MNEDVLNSNKIALVSCSGLSPLGLVARIATIELAVDNDNIVTTCITQYSAQPNQCMSILKDAMVVSITGCSDDCVDKILKEKGINVQKNINVEEIIKNLDIELNDSARLDDQGELAVFKLKEIILKELEPFLKKIK